MSQDFLRELVQLYRSVDLIHYYGAFKMKPRRRMFFTHAVSRPLLAPVSTNRVCKLSTQSRPSSPPKPCAPSGITTCKLFGSVRATVSPLTGGVTGSHSPVNIKTATSERTGFP